MGHSIEYEWERRPFRTRPHSLCPLGELLIASKYITRTHLEEALRLQEFSREKLGQILFSAGYISLGDLIRGLKTQQMLITMELGSRPLHSTNPVQKERIGLLFLYLRIIFSTACLVILAMLAPYSVRADETIITKIEVNHEVKGEFFVDRTQEGDFLVRTEDFRKLGFQADAGKVLRANGRPHISLTSLKGLTLNLNEETGVLEITAPPDLLETTTIDLLPPRREGVYYPKDTSVFLNYGLAYNSGNSLKLQSFSAANELGIRFADFLFLSNSVYSKTNADEKFTRLFSSVTHDRRDKLDSFVFGDFYATSGTLGSTVPMGGISYSKNYAIDPYLIKRPTLDYRGFVSMPSEISIYVDGARMKTEKISPGGFDLRNIVAYNGSNNLNIVVKDAFGREQSLAQPFYVSDLLLAKGLHDYSYNIGFLREQLGLESNQYSNLAFLAYHRYGVTNSVTLGLRAEAMNGLYNLGPQLMYSTNYGVFGMALSNSGGSGGTGGFAVSGSYTYQSSGINARFNANAYTDNYSTICAIPGAAKPKYDFSGGISYGTDKLGSLSFNVAAIQKYEDQNIRTASLVYTKTLTKSTSLYASVAYTDAGDRTTGVTLGITYYPWEQTMASFTAQREGSKNIETLQVQKNAPTGEGYGYRVIAETTEQKGERSSRLAPYFQYNGKYGIYSAEYSGIYGNGRADTYTFSAAGSAVYAGNTVGFSRPISDSFAIVNVDKLKGVRVYRNNQEVEKTGSSGNAVIPNLSSYADNNIAIDDKDIPVNYNIAGIRRYVSPPLRSGTFLKFEATRIQAFSGTLKIALGGKTRTLENIDVLMIVDGKEVSFPTGMGGEFYFENTKPGTYRASLKHGGKRFSFDMVVPESNEMMVNMGEIIVKGD
jgi:outer membrane usher protein